VSARPVFSLLHASARPEEWREVCDDWLAAADDPSTVEYILSVHRDDLFKFPVPPNVRLIAEASRRSSVDGWNAGAKASTGQVLVVVADDFFPPEHWDTLLLDVLGDITRERVVHVNAQDPWPNLITHPILTRAYYEKPGRGGCRPGDLFWHEYVSMGADDDFTIYAYRDGVVIDARDRLTFDHRHPSRNGAALKDMDKVYQHQDSAEAFAVKDRVMARRRAAQFGCPLKTLAIITPGNSFSAQWLAEWERLFHSFWGKFDFWRAYGQSNNIYLVREAAARTALEYGVPDYALWIDSDNPPAENAFAHLMAQMQASERNTDPALPSIEIIGAWYRYMAPDDTQSRVAAGRDLGLRKGQVTEPEVLAALERGQLVEDLTYIGFGMLLMRGSVLASLGPSAFHPKVVDDGRRFLTDDVSWCARAVEAGYRIYLHPSAFVEHLKFGPVKAVMPAPVAVPISEAKQLEEVAS